MLDDQKHRDAEIVLEVAAWTYVVSGIIVVIYSGVMWRAGHPLAIAFWERSIYWWSLPGIASIVASLRIRKSPTPKVIVDEE